MLCRTWSSCSFLVSSGLLFKHECEPGHSLSLCVVSFFKFGVSFVKFSVDFINLYLGAFDGVLRCLDFIQVSQQESYRLLGAFWSFA